jgi:transcriptional regulator with XRE-family HTH domain
MADRRPRTKGTDLAAIWGSSLCSRRKVLGLSRAQLARCADMTPQAIWMFETGQRIPLDRTKVVLARALGTTPGDLFPWPPMEDLVPAGAAA